jgi:diazepam-binding inhibitor (GABA receptor modulator, acyl-CoA-binding protein)
MIVGRSRTFAESSMSDVDTRFDQAVTEVKQLPERPGDLTLLRLYGLYKQATAGDAPNERPGFADIAGRYKHEAWAALKGLARETAKQEYIELVESLKGGGGRRPPRRAPLAQHF